jgi:hypothetical protein
VQNKPGHQKQPQKATGVAVVATEKCREFHGMEQSILTESGLVSVFSKMVSVFINAHTLLEGSYPSLYPTSDPFHAYRFQNFQRLTSF